MCESNKHPLTMAEISPHAQREYMTKAGVWSYL